MHRARASIVDRRPLPRGIRDSALLKGGGCAIFDHLPGAVLCTRLLEESSSYQKVKDGMRRDLALTKLVQEGCSVSEVAELVGYSEARSFTRAFRNWTGLSPREYCRYL